MSIDTTETDQQRTPSSQPPIAGLSGQTDTTALLELLGVWMKDTAAYDESVTQSLQIMNDETLEIGQGDEPCA